MRTAAVTPCRWSSSSRTGQGEEEEEEEDNFGMLCLSSTRLNRQILPCTLKYAIEQQAPFSLWGYHIVTLGYLVVSIFCMDFCLFLFSLQAGVVKRFFNKMRGLRDFSNPSA